ncbi:MAG TPA: VOC family protein [Acidimicrobiales bacterium]|nr:VOC family protein [Acidimicrobiales bacterium]
MPVQLNHTIVHARDAAASAAFLSEILGVEAPGRFGPFHVVEVANGVSLDYMDTPEPHPVGGQHYAFLVTEPEFDEIFGRIQERGLDVYADPAGELKGQVNHNDGGRGLYWSDPDGHWLEILTVPYGGWPA